MRKVEVKVPMLGESAEIVTIIKWLKEPGDEVKENEPLMEFSTTWGKAFLPSNISGILVNQLYKEGKIVRVGTVVAEIEQSNYLRII